MSKDKIRTLVYDRDLTVRTDKMFPISQDGSKISIKSGGKANFNPLFSNDCILQIPKRFGRVEKIAVVRNKAKSCFRFRDAPTELSEKIKTKDDLKEVLEAAEGGNTEAQQDLDLIMIAIENDGRSDFLKPDPETVLEMAKNEIAKGLGSEPDKPVPWYTWAQLILIIILFLGQIGVM